MTAFNELNVDLDDQEAFPSLIYERTKENPNKSMLSFCHPCNGSLDEYAKQFLAKLVSVLGDAGDQ